MGQIYGDPSLTLADIQLIVAPVHLGSHWVCIAADLSKKVISYYDSLKVLLVPTPKILLLCILQKHNHQCEQLMQALCKSQLS